MPLMARTIEATPDVQNVRPPYVLVKNRLVGTIIACRHSPCLTYRVRTLDSGLIDFVPTPLTGQPNDLDIGQQVILDILANDVMLSPPRWVHPSEDNHWPARIVLAANREFDSLLIVKILGRFWTLSSTQSPFWLNRRPRAWDRVTVHIPPDAICIRRRYPGHPRLHPRLLTQVTCGHDERIPSRPR